MRGAPVPWPARATQPALYDQTLTGGTEVSLEELVAPRIEPEIVLGFTANLHPDASLAEISAAIGWAAPGFEIVQCHYPGWAMTPADAIADAGLHGVLVVGEHRSLVAAEALRLAEVEVALHRGSDVVARGRGSDVLGGPVDAIAWLLRLPGIDHVRAGTIVTTGTLTAALPVAAGESWRLDTTGPVGLDLLEVRFS